MKENPNHTFFFSDNLIFIFDHFNLKHMDDKDEIKWEM